MVKRGLALLSFLGILAILVAFSGCVGKKEIDPNFRIAGDFELNVTSIQKTLFYNYVKGAERDVIFAPKGNFFVFANFSVKNAGSSDKLVEGRQFQLISLQANSTSAFSLDDSFAFDFSRKIGPGETRTGLIYFIVPWNETPDRAAFLADPSGTPGESPISWTLLEHEKEFRQVDNDYLTGVENIQ